MKNLTRHVFIKSLVLVLAVAFLGSCKKDNGGGGSSDPGKGTFTIKGTTYNGTCTSIPATSGVSGNIDVLITTTTGAQFVIYNMPTGSSGVSNVTNFDDDNSAFTSKLYALSTGVNGGMYASVSGTVTKTGAKAYNFSIKMIDLETDAEVTATGNGKY